MLSGFFSGAETALVAVSRYKVRFFANHHMRGSAQLFYLKKHAHYMLSTILICNNIVNIFASVFATKISLRIFHPNTAMAYATGIMTFLLLLFGEITPKNFATIHANQISLFVAPVIYFLTIVLYPIVKIFDLLTVYIFRIKRKNFAISEEELRNIVDIASEEGGIDEEEKEMIQKIFRIDDIDVDEIKIPRSDITMVKINSTLNDVLKLMSHKKYSRFPVYKDNMDDIVGIFYYKDALSYIQNKQFDMDIKDLIREPVFIPETKKIDATLRMFQKQKQQMAILIDEHGGVSGLVTSEDIIEEIVGDIWDETEKIKQDIKRIGKKTYWVLAKTHVRTVKNKLHINLQENDNYDTLSGYILNTLGKIPAEKEEIKLDSVKIVINTVKDNRVIDVLIIKN